jgi:short-subunit dehydrogenase
MKSQQHTALVTGASSGMGAEFARVLAKRSCDLILTARRRDRLEQLKRELESAYPIQVFVAPADLSSPVGAEDLFRQVQTLGKNVNVLINNAGFGVFGPFLDQTVADIEAMIQVDLRAVTVLTRLFAEPMKQQRYGFIMQNSSYAGLQPIPQYAVYSAAKAYLITLAQAIRAELRKSGISISVLCPGFTHTEFHDVAQHHETLAMRILSVSPRRIAEIGVKGMFRRKGVITPGVFYHINNWLLPFMPRSMAAAIAGAIVRE